MTTQMTHSFDLSQYLRQLLATNESNEGLRKQIEIDIELTRSALTEELLRFDIDFNQLNTSYHNLSQFDHKIKSLETQLNDFFGTDLMTKITKFSDICNESNDRVIRAKQLSTFIHKLKQIKSEMNLIDDSIHSNSYETSVQLMSSASELHKELISSIESNNDLKTISKDLNHFLDSIKCDLIVKREEFIYNTKQLFNNNVKAFRDDFNREHIFEFNLIKYLKTNEYKNFIKAFVEIRENTRILSELIKCFDLYFIKPILNEEINQLVLEDNRIIGSFSSNTTSAPLPLLKTFFDYLSQIITNRNEITIGRQLLQLFGSVWTEDVFNQILKYYLNRLMPKNESEVKSYLLLVDSAEDIRLFLIQIGFIKDDNNSPFIAFALNINSHFSSRLCTDFLLSAKTIICRDLHQTVEVSNDSDNESNSFPSCRVSQMIVELKELIEQIFDLYGQCSADCGQALIETIANICELYIDISPVFHNKMITQFPQQNAIFHNNCMFFAHFVECFARKHKLNEVLNEYPAVLRELGSKLLIKQMKSQEKILLELVQNQQFCHCLIDMASEDSKSGVGEQLAKEFRQVLKQCLVDLNFLRNALIEVLPQRVYDKAIGTLVNTLFIELINKIQMQNDISSSGAFRLSQEIEFLLKEMKSFLNSENPMLLVHKWSKLSELNFILNASLLDIVNRWADGKGILEMEFTAQEVKQLIRALFQNTERRAQALNKITSNK